MVNKKHEKKRAMTKAFISPIIGLMNILCECWNLWKKDSKWDTLRTKQKLYVTWFSLSFASLFIFAESWLIIPVLVNFAYSAEAIRKNINISEDI